MKHDDPCANVAASHAVVPWVNASRLAAGPSACFPDKYAFTPSLSPATEKPARPCSYESGKKPGTNYIGRDGSINKARAIGSHKIGVGV